MLNVGRLFTIFFNNILSRIFLYIPAHPLDSQAQDFQQDKMPTRNIQFSTAIHYSTLSNYSNKQKHCKFGIIFSFILSIFFTNTKSYVFKFQ